MLNLIVITSEWVLKLSIEFCKKQSNKINEWVELNSQGEFFKSGTTLTLKRMTR